MIRLEYNEFKTAILDKGHVFLELDMPGRYQLYSDLGSMIVTTSVAQGGSPDQTDYETNYQDKKEDSLGSFDPGIKALSTVQKLGPDGTHKQIIAPEIDMQGWVHEKDSDNNDLNYVSFEYYKPDGSGGFTSQVSADSDTTRTIVHWEPDYTYHIISGTAELLDTLGVNEEIYLNLQGLRGNLAGEPTYNFVQGGIRMRPERLFGLESNSSREMPYVEMDLGAGLQSLHTNRLSFIFDYTAGINPKVQILITRMVEPGK